MKMNVTHMNLTHITEMQLKKDQYIVRVRYGTDVKVRVSEGIS